MTKTIKSIIIVMIVSVLVLCGMFFSLSTSAQSAYAEDLAYNDDILLEITKPEYNLASSDISVSVLDAELEVTNYKLWHLESDDSYSEVEQLTKTGVYLLNIIIQGKTNDCYFENNDAGTVGYLGGIDIDGDNFDSYCYEINTVGVVSCDISKADAITFFGNISGEPTNNKVLGVSVRFYGYQVSYEKNADDTSIANMPEDYSLYLYNAPITVSTTTPTRDGYKFLGWNTNDGATTVQTFTNGEYKAGSGEEIGVVYFYAVWQAKTAIAFDTSTQRFVYDNSAKAPNLKDTSGKAITLTGFSSTYEMYYYSDYGSCTDTKEPGLYKAHITRAEDDDYQAVDAYIEFVVTFSLTYKANTGVGEDVIDISDNDTIHKDYFGAYYDDDPNAYYFDAQAIIKENTFTKDDYTFAFWNTKQDGTGTSYKPADLVTLKDNTILYACYSANISVQPAKDNNYTVSVATSDDVSFVWEKEIENKTSVDLSKITIDSGVINNEQGSITAQLKGSEYRITIICTDKTKNLMFDTEGVLKDGVVGVNNTYIYSYIGSRTKLYVITSNSAFTISNINYHNLEYATINTETASSVKNANDNLSYRCVVKSKFGAVSYSSVIKPNKVSFIGGTDTTGTAPSDMYQLERRKITLPANTFAKTGLSFIGWTDGSKTYREGSEYTVGDTNAELTAVFGHICSGTTFDIELDSTFTGGELKSGHYYLTSDITLTSNIVDNSSNSEIILCLNGHFLNLNNHQIIISGLLEVYNCSDSQEYVHNYKVNADGLWVLTTDNATKTLDSLTAIPSTGDIISVKGSAITGGNGRGEGGAIYAQELRLNNITFIGNNAELFADSVGGAVYAQEATIINCKFYGNTGGNGSAVSGLRINIYNSTFKFNTAYQFSDIEEVICGGNGTILCSERLLINGSTLQYNKATKGGAVFLDGENVIATIIDSTITNNIAEENGAGVCFGDASCFVEGTLITMADGSTKAIEEIKVGDEVKSFNHETGKYESHQVNYVYGSKDIADYYTLNFESGAKLGIVDCHDLFSKEFSKYVTITNKNYSDFIDKYFYNTTLNSGNGGWDKLVSVTPSEEDVYYYSIYVGYTVNSIANGFLTCPDDGDYRLNIYKFNENLVADSTQLQNDIETYGIKELSDCVLIESQAEYDMLGIKYYNIYIGKGLITARELNNQFYEIHNYDEYTEGVDGLTLIIGKNTIIKNNKVDTKENNVYLRNGSEIAVIDGATNINVGVTLENTLGTFANNVYSNNIGFTSDNTIYGIKKTLNSGKYTYSISLIKEEPCKDNDYTVVLDETIKDEYSYQWYEDLGTYKLSELDSEECTLDYYDEVNGDTIVAKYDENFGYAPSYVVSFYFNKDVPCFIYFDCDAENLIANVDYFSYIVSHINNHYIVLSKQGEFGIFTDECSFSLENVRIQKVKKLTSETSAKFGSTTLNNSPYFCNIFDGDELLGTSISIKPNKVSFVGGTGATGTAPSDIYQLEKRKITIPTNPFTKTGNKYLGWNTNSTATTALTFTDNQYTIGSSDATFYAVWQEKTSVSITETAQTYTYNGQTQGFALKGTHKDIGSFTVEYYIGTSWTTTTPTNAGYYKVKITRAEDDTYQAYEKEITNGLIIDKATAIINPTNVVKTYTYSGIEQVVDSGATLNHNETTLVYTNNKFIDVATGKYIITISAVETTNYKPISVNVEIVVNKLAVNEPMVIGTYQYSGESQTVILSGVESYMTTSDSLTQTNVGGYTITYTLDNNYTWASGSDGIVSWEIKALSIVPQNEQDECSVQKCIIHWFLLGLLIALLLFITILWFGLKIRNFKDEDGKTNVAPIVGFAIYLVALVALAILWQCNICIALIIIDAIALVGSVALYGSYQTDKNNPDMR